MPNNTVPAAAAVFGAVSAAAQAPAVSRELLSLIEAHRKAEDLVAAALVDRDEAEWQFRKSVSTAEFESGLFETWSFDPNDADRCRKRLAGFLDHERVLLAQALCRADATTRESFKQLWDQHIAKKLAQFDAFCARVETFRAQSGYLDAQRSATEALQAADALFLKICGWRCGSIEELRVKGKYLLQNEDLYINGAQEEALLRSLAEASDVEG